MKKLLIISLFSILYSLFSLSPVFAQEQKKIGAHTAVYLQNVNHSDIDKIYQMNSGVGGTLVIKADDSSLNLQSHFNNLVSYAAQKGVEIIVQTEGGASPAKIANFLNQGAVAIKQAPNAITSNIGLVIENEVNDPMTSRFPGTPEDYADYAQAVLTSVYGQPNGQQIVGMLSNMNITHPGGIAGGIQAKDYYQQMASHNSQVFSLARALASNAYPISPAGNPNIPGVLSYQRDLEILRNLGISTNNLQAVHIIETAWQQGWEWLGIHNQEEFIAKYAHYWVEDPHINSVNFFNALGKNPEWGYMSLFPFQGDLLSLFSAIKKGAVSFTPAGVVAIDYSKLYQCFDNEGNFVGWTLDEASCLALLQFSAYEGIRPYTRGTPIATDFDIDYRLYSEKIEEIPLTPTPVLGISEKIFTRELEGKLKLEKGELPDFSLMEERLNFALPNLLPQKLAARLSIPKNPLKTWFQHFIFDKEKKEITKEIPETEVTLPSWWTKVLGETKILCGIFNTCEPVSDFAPKIEQPKEEAVKLALNPELPSQKADLVKSEPVSEITTIKEEFSVPSLLRKIIETIEEIIGRIFRRKIITTEEATLTNKSRGILIEGKTLTEQADFFENFLPKEIKPQTNEALSGGAEFSVSEDFRLKEGSEKLNYHDQEINRARYCLHLCSLYPAKFDISQIDPLCVSCNLKDYQ